MSGIISLLLAWSVSPLAQADEPIDLTGSWTWEWKDAEGETHRHILEIKHQDTGYVALERFDNEPPVPVKDLEVRGQEIEFEVHRGVRISAYKGKITDADTINGEVSVTTGGQSEIFAWTAKRLTDLPEPEPPQT